MKKRSHRPRLYALHLVIAVILVVASYTIWDNRHIIVVRQSVSIRNLPEAFEGFTILQISDLHGRYFGRRQVRLAARVNATEYDMLAITGDMADGYQTEPDYQPFFDLLDAIEDKEHIFYADGNTGPWGIETFEGGLTDGTLTDDGEAMEARGVHNLTRPYTIQRGTSQIWIGEFWLIDHLTLFNVGFADQRLKESALTTEEAARLGDAKTYAQQLIKELAKIGPNDTLIGITHYPFAIDAVSEMPENEPPYDLVLAGHYHGGQIRLPLLGAIYIPNGASETRGFFPAEDEVSGLKDWGPFQQYISRGLGASGSISWLNVRLFNTPEINLITLTNVEDNPSRDSSLFTRNTNHSR
jgi:hypothetical protein